MQYNHLLLWVYKRKEYVISLLTKVGCVFVKIIIKGLDVFEQRILQTTVKLYEKRETQFTLVTDAEMSVADAIVVDARDADAMDWAEQNGQLLQNRVVIWIDGEARHKRHAELRRPVLWVNLPIILSRILDDISVKDVTNNAKPAPVSRNQTAAPVVEKDNRKVILVVDDSLAIRNYLSSLLEAEGYAVRTAEDGESALELFQAGKTFDCVFMDVLMPGIDGYAACRKIKGIKGGKKIPVIMLTGKGSAFDRIRGKMAGCNAYLVKPVDAPRLHQTLSEYV